MFQVRYSPAPEFAGIDGIDCCYYKLIPDHSTRMRTCICYQNFLYIHRYFCIVSHQECTENNIDFEYCIYFQEHNLNQHYNNHHIGKSNPLPL